ncbi:vitamin K epoxide reductase family protein [Ulvibacterium marinum]|uniref:Vitamin K epoxide reductase domain-containing protein n=1 Tax=Ulvibacterium marinum TaxID=2419782 RepID=A0A3B0C383_9FLAO|nr:vitamin K epoxide reductase family protein [Ulvibacterium marinum]RKN79620.1 hypothetical protein D7Z94_15095 [Ulvibacterium marinum]
MKDSSLFYILKAFLKKQGLKTDFDELEFQLLSHPSYPSLHSVTGVLNHFGIENLALKVPINRDILGQLPKTFITLNKKDQFLVAIKEGGGVSTISTDRGRKKISVNKFLESWRGIVVVTEKEDEILKKAGNNKVHGIVYLITICIILGLFFFQGPTAFRAGHFLFSIIGFAISVLIVRHELGLNTRMLHKVCSANETTSCDAVLNSNGATILKWFKLSDASFVYFLGLVLSWNILLIFRINDLPIILLTVLALPITLYSIFYQIFVVKKWCPLCLGIVVVLWMQACTLIFFESSLSTLNVDSISIVLFLLGFWLAFSFWLFSKPLLVKQIELKKLSIAHNKFKRNYALFDALLAKSNKIQTGIPEIEGREIVLGNAYAPIELLMVTNPLCIYCKSAHHDLKELLRKNHDSFRILIRFNVSTKTEENLDYRVTCRLLELYSLEPQEMVFEALHEVYLDNTDLNMWLSKWGEVKDISFKYLLERQQQWCHSNGINFTPAVLINGREFPKEYERSDIAYFVEDLIEGTEIKEANPV